MIHRPVHKIPADRGMHIHQLGEHGAHARECLGLFGNVEQVITDGGPPYDSREFRRMARRMGFKHHITTPENPQANGFVEVFQKVLVKMVHTAVVD